MIKIVLLPESDIDPATASKAHAVARSALRDPALSIVKEHHAVRLVWFRNAEPGETAHELDADRDRELSGFVLSSSPDLIFLDAEGSFEATVKTVLHELGHAWDFTRDAHPQAGVKSRPEKSEPEREEFADAIARRLRRHQYA